MEKQVEVSRASLLLLLGLHQGSTSGMHGRGSQASTPASDAGGMPQTACPCRVVPRGDSRIGPTRAEIGADAAQIRPTWSVSADIGRIGRNGLIWAEIQKKKKKKGAKRTI